MRTSYSRNKQAYRRRGKA